MYFQKTIANLKELHQLTSTLKQTGATVPQGQAPTGSASSSKLDPQQVAEALAEAMQSNNAATQKVAIRVNQLSQKYPNRSA